MAIGSIMSLLASAPVVVAHTFETSGTILLGDPWEKLARGLTEVLAPCNPTSSLNGLDGVWFDISGFGTNPRHAATLSMVATLDADAHFYDDSCHFISAGVGSCGQELIGVTEECQVPSTSFYVVVNGGAGTGSFTLKIT